MSEEKKTVIIGGLTYTLPFLDARDGGSDWIMDADGNFFGGEVEDITFAVDALNHFAECKDKDEQIAALQFEISRLKGETLYVHAERIVQSAFPSETENNA